MLRITYCLALCVSWQLIAAQLSSTDIRFATGAGPFPIYVTNQVLNSSTMKAYRLFYEMDADLIKLYKKLGLDVAVFNGPGRYVLPVPGSFVIDQKGFVVARHATTD